MLESPVAMWVGVEGAAVVVLTRRCNLSLVNPLHDGWPQARERRSAPRHAPASGGGGGFGKNAMPRRASVRASMGMDVKALGWPSASCACCDEHVPLLGTARPLPPVRYVRLLASHACSMRANESALYGLHGGNCRTQSQSKRPTLTQPQTLPRKRVCAFH